MYVGLAKQSPEIYMLHIAMTLNNLASAEYRNQEARQEFEEALKIYESFANQDFSLSFRLSLSA